MMKSSCLQILAFLLLFASIACTSDPEGEEGPNYSKPLPPGASALELVTELAEYPDFRAMWRDRDGVARALENSLDYFTKPSSHNFYPSQGFTHERVVQSLTTMKEILAKAKNEREFSGYCQRAFDVYRSVGWNQNATVLFTAYYQPIFDGTLEQTDEYRYPLYRLPSDLVKADDGTPLGRQDGETVVGYWTRREIDERQPFEGQNLEFVWLKSALDAFIIHVQGSAQIRLPSGDMHHIGYAGKTEHDYTSIGKELVADGKFTADELSLARIRVYFEDHPGELEEYLNRNESFVFFTETDGGGPYGSLGAAVTSYRTIATDKSIFPRGALCAIETRVPQLRGGTLKPKEFHALVFDQDTGGAIRSAGRCDLFVGTGDEAEQIAGHTKYEGQLFYLFVKEK
ncbi:MAG: membrane-bound lytic murein transglycosylase A [Planctomycetota bacterium]|jgi:membrane-bound lytic murein transglycosylase A